MAASQHLLHTVAASQHLHTVAASQHYTHSGSKPTFTLSNGDFDTHSSSKPTSTHSSSNVYTQQQHIRTCNSSNIYMQYLQYLQYLHTVAASQHLLAVATDTHSDNFDTHSGSKLTFTRSSSNVYTQQHPIATFTHNYIQIATAAFAHNGSNIYTMHMAAAFTDSNSNIYSDSDSKIYIQSSSNVYT